jgi:hypothetical protein
VFGQVEGQGRWLAEWSSKGELCIFKICQRNVHVTSADGKNRRRISRALFVIEINGGFSERVQSREKISILLRHIIIRHDVSVLIVQSFS